MRIYSRIMQTYEYCPVLRQFASFCAAARHTTFLNPNAVCYLQLIATPFAYGSVYFDPLWALITLAISYFFGKCMFFVLNRLVMSVRHVIDRLFQFLCFCEASLHETS